jgi:hypothetical protein
MEDHSKISRLQQELNGQYMLGLEVIVDVESLTYSPKKGEKKEAWKMSVFMSDTKRAVSFTRLTNEEELYPLLGTVFSSFCTYASTSPESGASYALIGQRRAGRLTRLAKQKEVRLAPQNHLLQILQVRQGRLLRMERLDFHPRHQPRHKRQPEPVL